MARAVATRMGFDAEAADLVALLVRRHLLLARTATTRDPDDPATVALLTSRVGSPEAMSLLTALTEADARATSPQAWTSWRSGLVLDLARRALAALDSGAALPVVASDPVAVPDALRDDPGGLAVDVERQGDGSRVTAVSDDRIGLLADVAAVFALQRLPVRAARAWAQQGPSGSWGVSVWDIASDDVDPALLRTRYDAVRAGRIDLDARFRATGAGLEPTVAVRAEASAQATVLEVRAADRPGVIRLVCAALAGLGVDVRSAHVETLGPQAVDVFYLREEGAGALSETRASEAAHSVRSALSAPT